MVGILIYKTYTISNKYCIEMNYVKKNLQKITHNINVEFKILCRLLYTLECITP